MTIFERTDTKGSTEFYVLQVNGDQLKCTCGWGAAPTRKQIKSLVANEFRCLGEEIEHVVVWHQERSCSMFVNKYAMMLGLPVNRVATEVYRAWTRRQYPDVKPASLGVVRGPAMLFGRQVLEGDV